MMAANVSAQLHSDSVIPVEYINVVMFYVTKKKTKKITKLHIFAGVLVIVMVMVVVVVVVVGRADDEFLIWGMLC